MLVGVFRLGVRRADITALLIVSLISSGIPGVEQRNTSFAVRQQADDAAPADVRDDSDKCQARRKLCPCSCLRLLF